MLPVVDRFLTQLEPLLYEPLQALPSWEMRRAVYTAPGVYAWQDQQPVTLRVGEPWGEPGITAFLRCQAAVPAVTEGFQTGLALVTGGEALVSINDLPYHGLDRNRWFVPLPPHLAGTTVNVAIEAFHPFPEPYDPLNRQAPAPGQPSPHVLRRAEIVRLNKALADLWYTMKVIRDAAAAYPDADPVRVRLLKSLAAAVTDLEHWPAERSQNDAEGVRRVAASLRATAAELGDKSPGHLVMIGQSHIDVAWKWPVKEGARKASRTFSTAATLLEEYSHYRFSQSQPQLYAFVRDNYPALFSRIKQLVKAGKWEIVGGMWVEPDLNIPSGEALVRQVLYGQRFWQQEFGLRSRVEWLPDTFGYCASLPQILRKAGLDAFMTVKMYWNDTNRFPYDLFWWQGIDGSRVLSFINHGLNESAMPADIRSHWHHFKQKDTHPEGMYLYGHGDGGGGVTREMLEYIAREDQLPGLPGIGTGTAHEFFARAAASGPQLPVWQGDLYLELHRGTYTTHARNKKDNRRCELLLQAAELWSTAAAAAGSAYPAAALHQAWEKLLLNQFHDILPGSSIAEVYTDSAVDYAEIGRLGNEAVDTAQKQLAATLHTAGAGQPIAVFNALSWDRADVVRLQNPPAAAARVCDETGAELPAQVVPANDGRQELWFLAGPVPSLGARVFWVQEQSVPPAVNSPDLPATATPPSTWETVRYLIEFNEQGCISRLFDKQHGREVVPAGQLANQLQLFQDRPTRYDAWDIDPRVPHLPFAEAKLVGFSVASRGPVADILRLRWQIGASDVTQDMVLYAHTGRIDFVTHVNWREDHKLLKVAFPVEILSNYATYEIPFGTVQRATHTNTTWEQAQYEVPAHKWADLSEPDYGVSLLNDCKYGYDIKGQVLRLSLLRAPKWPDPNADRGEHTFTYSLYPHAGDWRQGATVREAGSLNVPLQAVFTDQHAGNGCAMSLATVSAGHVILDTVKRAEDDSDIILRLYEAYGQRGPVSVQLHLPAVSVVETNLLEEPEKAVTMDGNAFSFTIRPYEIRTFRVKLGAY